MAADWPKKIQELHQYIRLEIMGSQQLGLADQSSTCYARVGKFMRSSGMIIVQGPNFRGYEKLLSFCLIFACDKTQIRFK